MKTRTGALVSMVAVALLAAMTLQVHAQTATPGIDQRQSNQAARIAKGEQTGALSKREAARMKAGQQKVADVKANAAADGKVTGAERQAIKREQNKQSRRIARQKLDGNKR
jgi:hypothetical protein